MSKATVTGKPVGFCCLGVACEVYNEIAVTQKRKKIYKSLDKYESCFAYNLHEVDLPEIVKNALKLNNDIGELKEPVNHFNCLAELNDGGWSHKKIAKYIRENPHNVFSDAKVDS